jgi:O-antigen/teichoic acid export membrane protein
MMDKVFAFLVTLLLTPYLISKLGLTQYGIWVLFFSFANYLKLAQFGASSSFAKYISEHSASKEKSTLRDFVCTAFYLSIVVACVIVGLTALFGNSALKLVMESEMAHEHSTLFLLLVSAVSIGMINELFHSIPQGLQRFDVACGMSMVQNAAFALGVFALMERGLGLEGAIAARAIANSLSLCVGLAVGKRMISLFSLNPIRFNKVLLHHMFSFGIRVQASYLSTWISQNFDKILLARFLDLKSVAIYEIGAKLVMLIRQVPMIIFTIFISRSSELNTQGRTYETNSLYVWATWVFALVTIGLIAFLQPTAPIVLNVWLRTEIDSLSTYTFRVLLLGAVFHLVTGVGTSIAKGIGKPGLEARASSLGAVLNIGLSLALFSICGVKGVVWGTTLSFMATTLVYFMLLNKHLEISSIRFLSRLLLLPTVVFTVSVFVGSAISNYFIGVSDTQRLFAPELVRAIVHGIVVTLTGTGLFLISRMVAPGFIGSNIPSAQYKETNNVRTKP